MMIYCPTRSAFPARVGDIIAFIVHLNAIPMAASSIATIISALGYFHKLSSWDDPTNSFIVQKILRGVRNECGGGDSRLPITVPILNDIVKVCAGMNILPVYRKMLSAMFLLAFFAFLRVGEMTASSTAGDLHNVLQFKDIVLIGEGASRRCEVTFHHFKHHNGHPVTISIGPQSFTACPMQALHDYTALRGTSPGPFFQMQGGLPVTRSYFTKHLRLALSLSNHGSPHLKSHSFRIGAASFAAQRGFPCEAIQQMGRWKSNAYKRYIRIPIFHQQ